ncbi:carbonic anhydrase [Desulfobacter hydrogenophilus]|uniref:Carbonic anhydrase n=1 Tax=Desulfobacter hydrogenophilus TaxID=2291 RepID=A0A328FBX4_9BACT|nr:carbonic anhydrase [Desulfobacter hydrogenophilus]NDY72975.1 carbonic anhydrase [Desulfobacter hydrogenophilus]QBH15248.1 carbonic anhydrase [Desulfobacter hydrogenophilus]RAM00922.1 carbonic anhydrase [Desulfobacter hydrogenophilus]
MKKTSLRLILCLLMTCMLAFTGCSGEQKKPKPSPDESLQMLKDGNERFLNGKSEQPHLDKNRMMKAGLEDQGDHAYATVLANSDSRVPVEAIFDAGIMDIFVIRVAGNVCDNNEVGSIEYGLAHVRTPVVVVLGNTQCGAVTAVTRAINGNGHAMERNIPTLFDNIGPAVRKTMEKYPQAKGDEIIPLAIEENVWTSIRDLFMKSPATRGLVKSGKAKVVGAIYDVSDGRVYWLEDGTVDSILQEVEADPNRAMEAMADLILPPEPSHDAAPETHEVAPDAQDDATDAQEIAPEANEAAPEAQEVEVAPEADEAATDAQEVAPETDDDAPEVLAPSEAEETPADPETHDSDSHL